MAITKIISSIFGKYPFKGDKKSEYFIPLRKFQIFDFKQVPRGKIRRQIPVYHSII